MKLRVYHSYYGCESGCCGHALQVDDQLWATFGFVHADSNSEDKKRELAREIVEKYLKEHHLECLDSIDWDSLAIDEIASYEECRF